MPASTNFLVFNEANDAARTYNDSEYENATQRQTGVIPGMAISRMHNKMFFQWSSMVKAIADFIVSKGYDAMDDDTAGMTAALESIIAAASSDLGYLLRQNNTAYAVGDIAFTSSLPSNMLLQCTTAGTTAATEPDFSGAVEGGTVTDGTAVWTYKALVSDGLDREQIPAFNYRDVVTTSGTYTAPVTGWYKITTKGGGGGGAGGFKAGGGQNLGYGGGGGGEGGMTLAYERMTAGDTAAVTIGAGGTGGVAAGGYGGNGGASSVVVNGNTYTGGGGLGGCIFTASTATFFGAGGAGTIPGNPGGSPLMPPVGSSSPGSNGGGNGGGAGGTAGTQVGGTGTLGGGGGGGAGSYGLPAGGYAGGAGGDGFAWFEYFAEV